jgi:hypothetical protein
MRIPILRPSMTMARLSGRSIPAMPKQREEHYGTPEHVAWRNAVIARAGRCCERCGRTNVRLWQSIRARQRSSDLRLMPYDQNYAGTCQASVNKSPVFGISYFLTFN